MNGNANNQGYRHEVFISYKWGNAYKEWVDKVFYPLLNEIMEQELPERFSIFKDTENVVRGAQDLPE